MLSASVKLKYEFRKKMKNNIVYVKFDDRGDRILSFIGKQRYGTEIDCTKEEWLQKMEEDENPCYWSQESRAWTYPGLLSFEEAQRGEDDWVLVKTIYREAKK